MEEAEEEVRGKVVGLWEDDATDDRKAVDRWGSRRRALAMTYACTSSFVGLRLPCLPIVLILAMSNKKSMYDK